MNKPIIIDTEEKLIEYVKNLDLLNLVYFEYDYPWLIKIDNEKKEK